MPKSDSDLIIEIAHAFPVSSGIAEWAESFKGGFVLDTESAPVVAYLLVKLYQAKKCTGGTERECECVPYDGEGPRCPVHDEPRADTPKVFDVIEGGKNGD